MSLKIFKQVDGGKSLKSLTNNINVETELLHPDY